jgi:hypothetical protein
MKLYTWGEIVCRLLEGDPAYKINAMYLEYENTAAPEDVVTVPSYDRDEGVEYYAALAGDPLRDFLRVPLLSNPARAITSGFEAAVAFNQLTFLAQSEGSVGVHGKDFSDVVNSKVFGVALVAAPVWGDRTRDLIWGRKYYATDKQIPKRASSQVVASWIEKFT